MNCNRIGEHLMDVAAGSAPEPQVDAHLRSCSACSTRLMELRQTMALLDEWNAPEPSPYFDTRLQARLREEAVRPRWGLWWFRKPALAMTLGVLLAAGSTLFITGHQPEGSSTLAQTQPESAVQDLQDLDRNQELFANFDLLDEIASQPIAQDVNP